MTDLTTRMAPIQLLICDVDGVLTDGKLRYTHEGIASMDFHNHDGVGLKLLQAVDIEVALITANGSPIINKRAHDLGIELIYQQPAQKMDALEDIINKKQLRLEQIAYIGDDLPDLPVIHKVGFAATVANAIEVVKKNTDYITKKSGGDGAVREVCDMILCAQNKTEEAATCYSIQS